MARTFTDPFDAFRQLRRDGWSIKNDVCIRGEWRYIVSGKPGRPSIQLATIDEVLEFADEVLP